MCDWFLPGYLAGGPIQSIATLTAHLRKDIVFRIITSDRDFKSEVPYSNVKLNEWTEFEGRSVYYISPDKLNEGFLLELIQSTPHDKIYLNSLFSKHFAVNPLKWKQQNKIESKIILAPRGMLGDGALAIKPLKKQLFLRYAKTFGYFKDVCWQSTSAQETAEIKKRIGAKTQISEVSNLPNVADEIETIEKRPDYLKLCFISRVSEKKNLNFAIDVLKDIKDSSIVFDVFGPIEDDVYWKSCLKNALLLQKNIQFNYKGVLKPEQVGATVSNYHALFLPTQNENYGHVIVETLQHGRPVILSDQTPWRNLEKENVGFDIPLNDKSAFITSIHKFSGIDQAGFDAMSKSCVSYINSKLNIGDIKQKYLELFGTK